MFLANTKAPSPCVHPPVFCGLLAVGDAAEGLVDRENQVPEHDEGDDHRADEERDSADAGDGGEWKLIIWCNA